MLGDENKLEQMPAKRPFNDWFQDFLKYSQNGHVPVSFKTPEGFSLGMWIYNIRRRKKSLTEEQIKLLTDHGFIWKEPLPRRSVGKWIEDFIKYQKNGYVPHNFVTPDGYHLGKWVSEVRAQRRKLTQRHIDILNRYNFKWNPVVKRTFEEWYDVFLKYNENGHVPYEFVTPEGLYLGRWITMIRSNKSQLTEAQIQMLNEANFAWRINNSPRSFEEWFEDFETYQENGKIPSNFKTPEGYTLGCWLRNVAFGNIKTTPEQREKLTRYGVKFGPKVRAEMAE